MSAAGMAERWAEASPRLKARIAGIFYLLNIVTGTLATVVAPTLVVFGDAAVLIASASYVIVTLLFYGLFKPVNRSLSLLAAFFSLVGIAIGALSPFHLAPFPINGLVFFGFYWLLIGYLIFRSTFLPRVLGVLLMTDGVGWMLFMLPPLANSLSPYIEVVEVVGFVAEASLMLWLLVMGVNPQRWKEQAHAAEASLRP